MFRRVVAAVPAQVGRIAAASVRPNIASPVHTAAPAIVPSNGRRQYHEKDKQSPAKLYHYNKPRNVGSMSKADTDVGTGLVGAPACGDVMKLQIRVDPNNNTISDVKFKTFGCGSAIASSSYLTELVRGMTLEDAAKIRNTEIAKELCLPPVKLHCSMLAEDAIKSAISNYYTKNPNARQTDLGGKSAPLPKVEVETITEPAAASV
ncbi:iron sulfur cluster assembly protein-like protein 1 [Byssothecium circinans]|uniref:Iron-sulfur cluster assembly protein n=1 Tax=Byssothecium circinans TaxID=147558 RepID=A0A6A5UDL6_9PLEO|nr:iron sulfur cluster assembly protein-like protein 1 [Byssothecium circinans]